jgi:hypothetical protein
MWLKRRTFMKKIIPTSLIFIGFLASTPFVANALDAQISIQNFREPGNNLQLAQYRGRQEQRYYVYYRNPRDRVGIWILAGFHAERRDAERAARRWERRGYRTDIRLRREANHHGGWGWGRDRNRQ